jgi:hypothetical protein
VSAACVLLVSALHVTALAYKPSHNPIMQLAEYLLPHQTLACRYHILVLIADGQVTRSSDLPSGQLSSQEQDTVNAIVEARCDMPELQWLFSSQGLASLYLRSMTPSQIHSHVSKTHLYNVCCATIDSDLSCCIGNCRVRGSELDHPARMRV